MTDTARNIEPIDPASTDGLAHLFVQGVLEESLVGEEGLLEQDEGVPVEVAAQQLGLSVSGVLKRLRKGVLPGFKVPSKRGEKWMVSFEALPKEPLKIVEDSLDLEKGVLGFAEDSLKACLEIDKDSSEKVSLEQALLDDLRRRNEDLEAKLQAASWRNGYLESKLEERETQIKLLTDSQHKPTWWQRFKQFWVKQ